MSLSTLHEYDISLISTYEKHLQKGIRHARSTTKIDIKGDTPSATRLTDKCMWQARFGF